MAAALGWLKLSGEIQGQDSKWSTIESLLKQEVPGLLGVENQVQIAGVIASVSMPCQEQGWLCIAGA